MYLLPDRMDLPSFYFFKFVVLVVALSCCSCIRPAVAISEDYTNPLASYKFSCEPIDSLEVRKALPVLEEEYGEWLDCPRIYRDKVLAALSFFPDLKGIKIRIIQKPLKTSMAARPDNFAVVRKKRRYKIYLDDITDKVTDFRKYPYSAQVGCFIHELGHVAYYETRSNSRLIYDGTNYVSSQRFRNKYERYADHNAVARGGGFFDYQYRFYTLNKAGISKKYRAFKVANYYTPKDLLRLHLEAVDKRSYPGYGCDSLMR